MTFTPMKSAAQMSVNDRKMINSRRWPHCAQRTAIAMVRLLTIRTAVLIAPQPLSRNWDP